MWEQLLLSFLVEGEHVRVDHVAWVLAENDLLALKNLKSVVPVSEWKHAASLSAG